MNITGKQIRAVRNERGLTQEQLSVLCQVEGFDISRGTLAKIESGGRQVTDIELLKLSTILQVSVVRFFA